MFENIARYHATRQSLAAVNTRAAPDVLNCPGSVYNGCSRFSPDLSRYKRCCSFLIVKIA